MTPEVHLQKLLPLFHHAPIAMAHTDAQGALRQVNPHAVQLMMPLAASLGLPGDNLLDTLGGYLPEMRQRIAAFAPESGMIMQQELYRIRFASGSEELERYFSLTIRKNAPDSLLIYFEDVTNCLLNADALRQQP